jgi:hypothetical protein
MTALKPVAGVCKLLCFQRVGADAGISSHLYYQTFAPPTQAQAQSAADAAHASYVTHLVPLLNFNHSLDSVTFTDLSTDTGPVGTNSTAVQGTRAQGEVPANAVALMNIHVVRRYRGGKPRVYWPFGSETDIATPQTWSAAFVDACYNGMYAFNNEVISNLRTWAPSATICSVSYFEGGEWKPDHLGNYHRVPTPRPVPLVDTVTGVLTFNQTIGSQRSRLRPN